MGRILSHRWMLMLPWPLVCLGCVEVVEVDVDPNEERFQRNSTLQTDETARRRFMEKYNANNALNDPNVPSPLVSLEEFFTGNHDYGSIGYNLVPQPEPSEFFATFKEIRERPEVHDVLVEVMDVEMPETDWPSADTIWIITTASPEEVTNWLTEEMLPDDVLVGLPTDGSVQSYAVPGGMTAVGIWWD